MALCENLLPGSLTNNFAKTNAKQQLDEEAVYVAAANLTVQAK